MLSFRSVSWSMGASRILDRVDLEVGAGEIVVLVGPSGVGKTTVLRLAAGLLTPTTGHVDIAAERTAMVFQEPRLLPWETALDNAALPLETAGLGRPEARRRASVWLERLALDPIDRLKRPATLSGGMKARVAIARAFAIEPKLVLMDEPFASLDQSLRADLQDLVRTLVDETGVGVLFVTHDLLEAARLADRVVGLTGRPARITADLRRRPTAIRDDLWAEASRLAAISAGPGARDLAIDATRVNSARSE